MKWRNYPTLVEPAAISSGIRWYLPPVRRFGRRLAVDLGAGLHELGGLLLHTELDGDLGVDAVLGCVVPDVLADSHRAELRAAHRAEVGGLGGRGRQRLVVIGASRFRVESQLELVLPPEFEARFG